MLLVYYQVYNLKKQITWQISILSDYFFHQIRLLVKESFFHLWFIFDISFKYSWSICLSQSYSCHISRISQTEYSVRFIHFHFQFLVVFLHTSHTLTLVSCQANFAPRTKSKYPFSGSDTEVDLDFIERHSNWLN